MSIKISKITIYDENGTIMATIEHETEDRFEINFAYPVTTDEIKEISNLTNGLYEFIVNMNKVSNTKQEEDEEWE